jgi:hypothetical protein
MKRHQIPLIVLVLFLVFLTAVVLSMADLTTVQHIANMVWSG